ncbi:MAG: hypothetical protein Kow0037_08090 [Calditrichia bacterium]
MIYRNKIWLVLLAVLIAGSSCVRYSFKGALPSDLKTIYIGDFENRTSYPTIREDLIDKLIQSFLEDGTLKVVDSPDGADLILEGQINSVYNRKASITQDETVTEYHLEVSVSATCINTHLNKPFWKSNFNRYGVMESAALGSETDAALLDALDQIVEDMLIKTIAAW